MNKAVNFFNTVSDFLNGRIKSLHHSQTPAEENLDGANSAKSITTNGTPLHVDETINVQGDLIVITKLEIVA
jgi:hypothetical protein